MLSPFDEYESIDKFKIRSNGQVETWIIQQSSENGTIILTDSSKIITNPLYGDSYFKALDVRKRSFSKYFKMPLLEAWDLVGQDTVFAIH